MAAIDLSPVPLGMRDVFLLMSSAHVMGLSYHSWLGLTGVLFFLLFISYAMRGDRQRKKFRYYQSCPLKDPEHFEDTILGGHLPSRYLHKYTPLFYKQFAVCIITVAWKLAQPKHIPLSSLRP